MSDNDPPDHWHVYKIPLVLGGVSLFFIILSLSIYIRSYQNIDPITFSDTMSASGSAIGSVTDHISVDIEGAVLRPGMYQLPEGSRVDDLIRLSGGLTRDADVQMVARTVNRAAKLADGAKVYIPFEGEVSAAGSAPVSGDAAGLSAANVNINTAGQSELEALSGIGPVTAGKIIANRPYMRLEELIEKKVLGRSLFEKLKDQLTL